MTNEEVNTAHRALRLQSGTVQWSLLFCSLKLCILCHRILSWECFLVMGNLLKSKSICIIATNMYNVIINISSSLHIIEGPTHRGRQTLIQARYYWTRVMVRMVVAVGRLIEPRTCPLTLIPHPTNQPVTLLYRVTVTVSHRQGRHPVGVGAIPVRHSSCRWSSTGPSHRWHLEHSCFFCMCVCSVLSCVLFVPHFLYSLLR